MKTMTSKMVSLEISQDGTIAIITLDKPPVNAWAVEDYIRLTEIAHEINASETIASTVLRADGRMFSAGADIKRVAADDERATARRRPLLRSAISAFSTLSTPLISAVKGHAVGVGAVLATSADIIVATPNSKFSIPEINSSIIGAAAAMRRCVPEHKARAMALTGGYVTGEELHNYGSVERLASEEEIDAVALELAQLVASKGYLTTRKWKEALTLNDPGLDPKAFMVEQCLSQELSALSPAPTLPSAR